MEYIDYNTMYLDIKFSLFLIVIEARSIYA